jgi:hypothetical protein
MDGLEDGPGIRVKLKRDVAVSECGSVSGGA